MPAPLTRWRLRDTHTHLALPLAASVFVAKLLDVFVALLVHLKYKDQSRAGDTTQWHKPLPCKGKVLSSILGAKK